VPHAPEVKCIGKGKASKPYELGLKNAVVVTHKRKRSIEHALERRAHA
jgi:hypothetical protein